VASITPQTVVISLNGLRLIIVGKERARMRSIRRFNWTLIQPDNDSTRHQSRPKPTLDSTDRFDRTLIQPDTKADPNLLFALSMIQPDTDSTGHQSRPKPTLDSTD